MIADVDANYQAADEALQAKIDALGKRVDELETAIDERIAAKVKEAIAGIQEQIDALQTQIDEIKGRLDTVEQAIEDLKEAKTTIESTIAEILKTIGDRPESEQRSLWDCIVALIAQDKTITDMIDTLKGGYEGSMSDLKKYVDDLVSTLRGGYDGSLKDLLTMIETINSETGPIWTAIKQNDTDIDTIFEIIGTTTTPEKGTLLQQLNDLWAALGSSTTEGTILYRIAQLEGQVSTLLAAIAEGGDIDQRIAAAKAELQEQVDAITKRLDEIPYGKDEAGEQLKDTIENVIADIEDRLDDLEDRVKDIEERLKEIKGSINSMVVIPDFSDGSIKVPFEYGSSKDSDVSKSNFPVSYKVLPSGTAEKIAAAWKEDNNLIKVEYKNTLSKGTMLAVEEPELLKDCTAEGDVLTVTVDASSSKLSKKFFHTQFLYNEHQAVNMSLLLFEKEKSETGESTYSIFFNTAYVELYPFCAVSLSFNRQNFDKFSWQQGDSRTNSQSIKVTSQTSSGTAPSYVGWKIASKTSWVNVYPEQQLYDSGKEIAVFLNSTNQTSDREGFIKFISPSGTEYDYTITQSGRTAQVIKVSPESGSTIVFNAAGDYYTGSGDERTQEECKIVVTPEDGAYDWEWEVEYSGTADWQKNWLDVEKVDNKSQHNSYMVLNAPVNSNNADRTATLKLIPATGADEKERNCPIFTIVQKKPTLTVSTQSISIPSTGGSATIQVNRTDSSEDVNWQISTSTGSTIPYSCSATEVSWTQTVIETYEDFLGRIQTRKVDKTITGYKNNGAITVSIPEFRDKIEGYLYVQAEDVTYVIKVTKQADTFWVDKNTVSNKGAFKLYCPGESSVKEISQGYKAKLTGSRPKGPSIKVTEDDKEYSSGSKISSGDHTITLTKSDYEYKYSDKLDYTEADKYVVITYGGRSVKVSIQ